MTRTTSAKDFAACEKADRLFDWVLGQTLEQAVVRMAVMVIGLIGCALVVSITALVV